MEIPKNTIVMVVTHRRTGLYHILTTREEPERALLSTVNYWNEIGKRTHKFLNYAVVEFSRALSPFLVSDFDFTIETQQPIASQEAKARSIDIVMERGTDKLLTSQLGFNGASWTLNTQAKHRIENGIPAPYLDGPMPEVQSGPEIRRGGQSSLRTADGVSYKDGEDNRFQKLTVDEVAKFFGDEYLITDGHRGIRIYKKLPKEN